MKLINTLIIQLSRIPIVLLLVIIIAIAGFAAVSVTGMINEQVTAWKTKQNDIDRIANAKATVIYTLKDITEGQQISSDAIEMREVQQSKVPQDAITSSALATGRIAKYGIAAGAIVSQHDLAPEGISLGFDSKLKEGMRAVTFAVDNNSGVAGFVNPDSRVDILAMVGTGAETKVAAILSDVEVIAVGQMYQKTPGQSTAMPSNSVTVSVNPADSTKLIKAISASKLYLALRNEKDHLPVATIDVTSMFPGNVRNKENLVFAPPPPPSTFILPAAQNISEEAPARTPEAQQPSRPEHEVEVWKSGSKDIIAVPLQ